MPLHPFELHFQCVGRERGGEGGIGALIGLFTHGLAIKKLLVTLSLSAQCNHRTGDKVVITACAERLKSPLNSAQYKLVPSLGGGNGQIIAPSEISLLLNLYHRSAKAIKAVLSSCRSTLFSIHCCLYCSKPSSFQQHTFPPVSAL